MALDEVIHRWQPEPHQHTPPGDWFIWCMQWGAGSGKTYTGAQYVRSRIDSGEWRTVNVAGPTWTDTMRTMVTGSAQAPGLLGVWPAHQKPELRTSKDNPALTCHNGARIQLFAAQKADRFRGAAADGAWADEIDSWKPEQMKPSEAFMLLEQRVRTGPDPRIIVTSTPRRGRLIAELRGRSDCVVTTASMYDNARNLNAAYVRAMKARYEGTRLGRQELLGEILEETEGAIVSPHMIEDQRVTEAPDLVRVVVGVDPFGGGGDACGIVVAGKGIDGHGYPLADRTCRLGPDGWGRRVIETALEFEADCIAWESNFGGDMVPHVLNGAMANLGATVRLKKVHSSKAKHIRFEPVGAMYERGEVHHVGALDVLEDQVCRFTPDGYDGDDSPNNADALVFAMTELFPIRQSVGWDDVLSLGAVQ